MCRYLHSSLLREATTTEEWLQEAKSLEESEEKQRRRAERSSLGSLDTWRRTSGDAQQTPRETVLAAAGGGDLGPTLVTPTLLLLLHWSL